MKQKIMSLDDIKKKYNIERSFGGVVVVSDKVKAGPNVSKKQQRFWKRKRGGLWG